MITSSTSSGFTPARFTLSRTTIAPSSVAEKPFSDPKNFPTGVRAALMITASFNSGISELPYVRLGPILDFISLFIKHAGTHSCRWQRHAPSPINSLHSEADRSDLQPAVSALSDRHAASSRHH